MRLNKRWMSLVALMMILAFVLAGCGGSQQPAKAPEPPKAAAPAVDPAAATKEAAMAAFKKVVADTAAKTFPLPADKAKELYVGNEAKYLVIDMRSAEDYAKGHVKGAVNLPGDKLVTVLDQLPRDKTLLMYCYTGQNCAVAMTPLTAYGYKVISISKGFPEVQKAGFPLDTAATEFKPVAAAPAADPKAEAALKGIKEHYDGLVKQAAAKTLIVPAADVSKLVAAAPDKYTIVDLRSAEDFDKAKIKGSVNIPFGQFADKLSTLPKDKTVVLVCYSGQTAGVATFPLKVEGYKMVSVSTGFPAAEAGGFAIEKK